MDLSTVVGKHRRRTYAFRPISLEKRHMIREFCVAGRRLDRRYNYHARISMSKSIHRIGSRLHYLGSHAPKAVQLKWGKVEKKFMNAHKKTM